MQAAKIPGYGLDAPNHESIIASFAKHVGPAEARRLWTDRCRVARVPSPPSWATIEQLRDTVGTMTREAGLIGITANAVKVRIITYMVLSRQLAPATAGAR